MTEQNKSSIKTETESILRRIITSKNIHAPDNTKLKNEIITDIKSILDEELQKRINKLTDSCVLLIGDDYKTILSACYFHCNRDIDQKDEIESYKQQKVRAEQNRIWHEKANAIPHEQEIPYGVDASHYLNVIHTDLEKTIGKEEDVVVDANLIDTAVKEYAASLTQFKHVDYFGVDITKDIIKRWLGRFNSNHTVFVEKLEIKDDKECQQFTRNLKDARINKPDNASGLIIVSTDTISNLPEHFVEQFELIPLDREKNVVVPVSETAKPNEQQEDKNSPLYKKAPENAKWQDLTMAFPNHLPDKVDIIFENKEKNTVPLKDLGFVDKKATKTFKPLEALTLLKRFAENKNCEYSSQKDEERGTRHAQVESLRDVLKRCFGIDGDPVPAIEGGGYRLLFRANCYDTEEKQEVDTYLESLNDHFRDLKTEASNTGNYRDSARIDELVELIRAVAKEIIKRTRRIQIKNAVCTECYQRISSYTLDKGNIQILCETCTPEPTSEYESQSLIDYKDNDISRND